METTQGQTGGEARLRKILAAVQALAPVTTNDEGGVSDGYYICPLCDGEGSVSPPYHITTCGAAGLQVYGIGADMTLLEAWVREAPALVAEMLDSRVPEQKVGETCKTCGGTREVDSPDPVSDGGWTIPCMDCGLAALERRALHAEAASASHCRVAMAMQEQRDVANGRAEKAEAELAEARDVRDAANSERERWIARAQRANNAFDLVEAERDAAVKQCAKIEAELAELKKPKPAASLHPGSGVAARGEAGNGAPNDGRWVSTAPKPGPSSEPKPAAEAGGWVSIAKGHPSDGQVVFAVWPGRSGHIPGAALFRLHLTGPQWYTVHGLPEGWPSHWRCLPPLPAPPAEGEAK